MTAAAPRTVARALPDFALIIDSNSAWATQHSATGYCITRREWERSHEGYAERASTPEIPMLFSLSEFPKSSSDKRCRAQSLSQLRPRRAAARFEYRRPELCP